MLASFILTVIHLLVDTADKLKDFPLLYALLIALVAVAAYWKC